VFQRILHANDGSESAFKAFAASLDLARRHQAPLHMVCVEELPRFATTIDEVVEEQDEANHRFRHVVDRAQTLARM
jgi:Universal stress protein family